MKGNLLEDSRRAIFLPAKRAISAGGEGSFPTASYFCRWLCEDMMVGAAAAILQQGEGQENCRDTDRGIDIIQLLKYSLNNSLLNVYYAPGTVLVLGVHIVQNKQCPCLQGAYILVGGKTDNNKYMSARVKSYGEQLRRIRDLVSDRVIFYTGG